MRRPAALLILGLLGACHTASNPPQDNEKLAEIHYRIGIDALQKGLLPKAFDELLLANRLSPKRADILDALGYAWRLRGDLKKAENYYKEALRHDPPPATLNNYGSLLLQLRRPKEAERYFRKALDDPRYRRPDLAYINLGDALLMQGRFREALNAYRQAKVLNPQQEISRMREAKAYEAYHRETYAEAVYQTILHEQPSYRPALEGLLALLKRQGRTSVMRTWLERFRDSTSNPIDRAWAEEQLNLLEKPR